MRNRRLRVVIFLGLLGATALRADEAADETAVAPPRSTIDRPEYLSESLPDDQFQPSKEINDDYAVPFPVDF